MIERTFRLVPAAYFMDRAMIIVMGGSALACLIPFAIGCVFPDRSMTPWQFFFMQVGLLGVAVILTLLSVGLSWAERGMHVELSDVGLVLHAWPAYRKGKHFAWSSLRISEARLGHFPADWRLKPVYNSHGCLGPGRLTNGHEALVFGLKDHVPFVYLPTTEGFDLLMEIEAPDEFLELLGNQAGVAEV